MCETCGCSVTPANAHLVDDGGALARAADGTRSVLLLRNLLAENDHVAAHNREHFDAHAVLAVNVMSAPGAGKTALLERTIDALGKRLRLGVIEGDLATENDAQRIRARGVPAVQITTGSACHLDAHMIHDALHELDLQRFDVLFIENVGNLVCPASFDLGQHLNVTLLSVTEGDDKPQKYPVMFRATDALVLSKCDLLAHVPEFDCARAQARLRELGNAAPVLQVSARAGADVGSWCDWLTRQFTAHREGLAQGRTRRPALAPDGAVLHAMK